MHSRTLTKFISVALSIIFTYSTLAAPLAEANIWQARRQAIEASKINQTNEPTKLASLPAGYSEIAGALPTVSRVDHMFKNLHGARLNTARDGRPSWLSSLSSAYGDLTSIQLAPEPAKAPLVVLIQDAHDIYSAQYNVSMILAELAAGYAKSEAGKPPLLVGVEGAAGSFNLSGFRKSVGAAHRDLIATFFMNRKLLSGPERFAVLAEPQVPVWGVETPSLYRENVEAYRENSPVTAALGKEIATLTEALRPAKKEHYSPALHSFDQHVAAYHQNSLSLLDYAQYLSSQESDLAKFPEVKRVMEALSLENTLDFKRVEAERTQVIAALTTKLNGAGLRNLLDMSLAYRAGRINYAEYFDFFKNTAAQAGVRLNNTAAFESYIHYVLLCDKIDAAKLFDQMESLKAAVAEKLCVTPVQTSIVKLSDDLGLVETLLNRELSPQDWALYQTRRASLARLPERLAAVTKDQSKDLNFSASLSKIEDFYRAADRRNEAMVANLLDKAKETGTKSMALVTGGFHTPVLERLFKEKGFSVVTVLPKIGNVQEGSSYLALFTMKDIPLDKLLLGEKLFIPRERVLAESMGTNTGGVPQVEFLKLAGEAEEAVKGAAKTGVGAVISEVTERVAFVACQGPIDTPTIDRTLSNQGIEAESLSPEVTVGDLSLTTAKTSGQKASAIGQIIYSFFLVGAGGLLTYFFADTLVSHYIWGTVVAVIAAAWLGFSWYLAITLPADFIAATIAGRTYTAGPGYAKLTPAQLASVNAEEAFHRLTTNLFPRLVSSLWFIDEFFAKTFGLFGLLTFLRTKLERKLLKLPPEEEKPEQPVRPQSDLRGIVRLDVTNAMTATVGKDGIDPEALQRVLSELEKGRPALQLSETPYETLVKEQRAWRESANISIPTVTKDIQRTKELADLVRYLWLIGEIDDVVFTGIGGSDLGARAWHEALNHGESYNSLRHRPGPRFHFVGDRFNARDITDLDDIVKWKKTLVIPISKSGSTPEPFAAYEVLKTRLKAALGENNYGRHVLAVTGQNESSLLFKENGVLEEEGGPQHGFLGMLPVPDGVGGRYSVFSPVGLIYAGIAGLDIDGLLEGFAEGARLTRELPATDPDNVAYRLAAITYLIPNANPEQPKNKLYFIVFAALGALGRWFRQGFDESLGKIKRIIMTVISAVGSTENHSSFQTHLDAANDSFFVITQVDHMPGDIRIPRKLPEALSYLAGKMLNQAQRAVREGSATALTKKGRPNVTIHMATLDTRAIGAYMSIMMHYWEIMGQLWEVNAFDQPAVEEYKTETRKILAKMEVLPDDHLSEAASTEGQKASRKGMQIYAWGVTLAGALAATLAAILAHDVVKKALEAYPILLLVVGGALAIYLLITWYLALTLPGGFIAATTRGTTIEGADYHNLNAMQRRFVKGEEAWHRFTTGLFPNLVLHPILRAVDEAIAKTVGIIMLVAPRSIYERFTIQIVPEDSSLPFQGMEPAEIVNTVLDLNMSTEDILGQIDPASMNGNNANELRGFAVELKALAGRYHSGSQTAGHTAAALMELSEKVNPLPIKTGHPMENHFMCLMIAKNRLAREVALALSSDEISAVKKATMEQLTSYVEKGIEDKKMKADTRDKVKATGESIDEWLADSFPPAVRHGIVSAMLEGRSDDLLFAHGMGWKEFGTAGIRNQAINSGLGGILMLELEEFARDLNAPYLAGPNTINAVTLLQQTATAAFIIQTLQEFLRKNPDATQVSLADLLDAKGLLEKARASGEVPSIPIKISKRFKEDILRNQSTFAFDSRLNGRRLAKILTAHTLRYGIRVDLFDKVAGMPALVYAASRQHSIFGYLISASHSEPNYNGFKFVIGELMAQVSPEFQKTIMAFRNTVDTPDMNLELVTTSEGALNRDLARRHKSVRLLSGRGMTLWRRVAAIVLLVVSFGQFGLSQQLDIYKPYYDHVTQRSSVKMVAANMPEAERPAFEGAIAKIRSELKILYTAFSGAGAVNAGNFPGFLKRMGYNAVELIKKHTLKVDGRFPAFFKGWKLGMPDPELEACVTNFRDFIIQEGGRDFENVEAALDKFEEKELVLATDPDIDRAGMAIALPDGVKGNVNQPLLEEILRTIDKKAPKAKRAELKERVTKRFETMRDKLHITANDAWMFMTDSQLALLEQTGQLRKDHLYVVIKSHVTTSGLSDVAASYRAPGKDYHVYAVDTYVGFTLLAERADQLFDLSKLAWRTANLGQPETPAEARERIRQAQPQLEAAYKPLAGLVSLIDETMEAARRVAEGSGDDAALSKVVNNLKIIANLDVLAGVEESNGYGEFGRVQCEVGKEAELKDEHIREKDGSLAAYKFAELAAYLKYKDNGQNPHGYLYNAYMDMLDRNGKITTTTNLYTRYVGAAGLDQKTENIDYFEKLLAFVTARAEETDQDMVFFGKYQLDKSKGTICHRDLKYDNNTLGFPEEGVEFNFLYTYKGVEYEIKVTYRPSGTGMENRDYNWVTARIPDAMRGNRAQIEQIRQDIQVVADQVNLDFFGIQGKEDENPGLLLQMKSQPGAFPILFAKAIGQKREHPSLPYYLDLEPANLQEMFDTARDFSSNAKQLKGKTTAKKRTDWLRERDRAQGRNRDVWQKFIRLPEETRTVEYGAFPKKIALMIDNSTIVEIPRAMTVAWAASAADGVLSLLESEISQFGLVEQARRLEEERVANPNDREKDPVLLLLKYFGRCVETDTGKPDRAFLRMLSHVRAENIKAENIRAEVGTSTDAGQAPDAQGGREQHASKWGQIGYSLFLTAAALLAAYGFREWLSSHWTVGVATGLIAGVVLGISWAMAIVFPSGFIASTKDGKTKLGAGYMKLGATGRAFVDAEEATHRWSTDLSPSFTTHLWFVDELLAKTAGVIGVIVFAAVGHKAATAPQALGDSQVIPAGRGLTPYRLTRAQLNALLGNSENLLDIFANGGTIEALRKLLLPSAQDPDQLDEALASLTSGAREFSRSKNKAAIDIAFLAQTILSLHCLANNAGEAGQSVRDALLERLDRMVSKPEDLPAFQHAIAQAQEMLEDGTVQVKRIVVDVSEALPETEAGVFNATKDRKEQYPPVEYFDQIGRSDIPAAVLVTEDAKGLKGYLRQLAPTHPGINLLLDKAVFHTILPNIQSIESGQVWNEAKARSSKLANMRLGATMTYAGSALRLIPADGLFLYWALDRAFVILDPQEIWDEFEDTLDDATEAAKFA